MSEFTIQRVHGELIVHYLRNVSKEPDGRLMVPDATIIRYELKVADRLLRLMDLLQSTFPDLLVEEWGLLPDLKEEKP